MIAGYRSPTASDSSLYGRFCPPIGADEADLLMYRDQRANRYSLFRNAELSRIALSLWYTLGHHWAEIDTGAIYQGTRGAILRQVQENDFPRPTTNHIDIGVWQEVKTFAARKQTAIVDPNPKNNARARESARRAVDHVNWRMDQLEWPELRITHAFTYVVEGTGILTSGWRRPFSNLTLVGSTNAVWCSRCSAKLASPEVDLKLLSDGIEQRGGGTLPTLHMDTAHRTANPDTMRLNYCPNCDDLHPLEKYPVSDPEAEGAADIYGRELGTYEPRGDSYIEVDEPFELFPDQAGARVTPASMKRFVRRKIRDIDFIYENYPNCREQVPDSLSDLLWDDPILSQRYFLGNIDRALDFGMLDSHKFVDEIIELPSYRHPMGRYIVCSDDERFEDGPLLIEAMVKRLDGKQVKLHVPRIQCNIARYKIRPGYFFGGTKVENAISPTNRMNSMDSMVMEGYQRMGPYIFIPKDMFLTGPSFEKPGYGKIVAVTPSQSFPDRLVPEVFSGPTMPIDVYETRDRMEKNVKEMLQTNPILAGLPPEKNIGATSALEFLDQQDAASRSLQQDSLVRSIEKAFTHINDLQHLLRVDDDEITVRDADGSWRSEAYRGEMLYGQTEVRISVANLLEGSIRDREATREGIADKLIPIDTPIQRQRALRHYGHSEVIDDMLDPQIKRAEESWADFLDKGIVRLLDQIDNPATYYEIYVESLQSDPGKQLTVRCGWDKIFKHLAGWELDLSNLVMQEKQSIGAYGKRFYNEEDRRAAYAQAMVSYAKKLDLWSQQQALATTPGAAGIVAPAPKPLEPIPPVLSPTAYLPDRIFGIWMSMLEKKKLAMLSKGTNVWLLEDSIKPSTAEINGYDDSDEDPEERIVKPAEKDAVLYIHFRSLTEACRLTNTGIPMPEQAAPYAPTPTAPTAAPAPSPSPSPSPAPAAGPVADDSGNKTPRDKSGATTPPTPPSLASNPEGGAN